MDKKENLKKLIESNQKAVKSLLDDITDDEAMRHDYENCNHILWQTGHLADSAAFMTKLLGDEVEMPPEWTKNFGYKSEIKDDASVYPAMNEVRSKLYSLYDHIHTALDKADTEYLDKEQEFYPEWIISPMDGLLFFCVHEFYHAGQITVMRRVLGRDKPFG